MLARQLLLERSTLSLTEALDQVAGLQTQYAPSGYVGLWSRVEGFRREDLTEALLARRVVQGTLMRSTIHLASRRDYRAFAAGTRPGRQAWWRRVRRADLEHLDMDAVANRVRLALRDEPRRHRDMVRLLEDEGYPPAAWQSVGQWLDLVRVPPSGTWEQRRADLYAEADTWLGPDDVVTEAEGLAYLVRSYLRGFGPASLADAASWAGLPVGSLRPAIASMDLVRYRDERGRELLDLPGLTIPDAATPAPVRFIHVWEALLLVHARRTLVLPEAYRPRIFNTKNPQSVATFLVDGVVAGTWKWVDGRVEVEPFEPLGGSARRAVDAEAERLADFHGDDGA
jgi:Winged helix DNA-binding domain